MNLISLHKTKKCEEILKWIDLKMLNIQPKEDLKLLIKNNLEGWLYKILEFRK